ncbi:MAG TPA: DUF6174 domain-containing protein [Gemmatimonadales bacterium]|nr:DUF6174 domain-containing protein [Gemmatimonadales bacterium]
MRRVLWLSVALAGCTGPELATVYDVMQHQTAWSSHQLTRYTYVYEETGFFNNLAGQAISLVVIGDTVRSATFVSSGDSVPVPLSRFPTIDGLFAEARTLLDQNTLAAIRFDPALAYPVRMDVSGLPDASGSIFASGLTVVP